jgi:pimeloyl-ACP methyl ester carboxylesterase
MSLSAYQSQLAAQDASGQLPAFIEQGQGDTLVMLLHGVGGGQTVWPWQLDALAGAGYRVVAWDMPGYGGSPLIDPYDMAGIAAACARLVRHLGASRAVLVGHSMGGMVAQELFAHEPALVAGLVLYGTSPAFGRPDGDWQQSFLRARLAPLDAGGTMPALARSLVEMMLGDAPDPQGVAVAVDSMSRLRPEVYRASLQALVGFDQRAVLDRIAVPTLALVGERDGNAPPAVMEKMAAKIRDAQYVCMPGAGHLASMEQPQAFNAIVLDFLRRHFPASNAADRH